MEYLPSINNHPESTTKSRENSPLFSGRLQHFGRMPKCRSYIEVTSKEEQCLARSVNKKVDEASDLTHIGRRLWNVNADEVDRPRLPA